MAHLKSPQKDVSEQLASCPGDAPAAAAGHPHHSGAAGQPALQHRRPHLHRPHARGGRHRPHRRGTLLPGDLSALRLCRPLGAGRRTLAPPSPWAGATTTRPSGSSVPASPAWLSRRSCSPPPSSSGARSFCGSSAPAKTPSAMPCPTCGSTPPVPCSSCWRWA